MKEYRKVQNFLSKEERLLVESWISTLENKIGDPNQHLSYLGDNLRGKSFIFNQSQTDLTNYITKFQSISAVSTEKLPNFILDIQDRIAKDLNLPKDHIFLQVVDMSSGGSILPHYDASLSGYINYKCNISVLSDDYYFYVDKNKVLIKEGDLYAFEASLYKHWTDKFINRRVFLSFGFIIPYNITGRVENDPRVRLSKRIEKYFQANN